MLRRNRALPEEGPTLPAVAEVEGFLFGVPAPMLKRAWGTLILCTTNSGLG